MNDWLKSNRALVKPASDDAPYGDPAPTPVIPVAGRELDAMVAEKVMGWLDVRDHQMWSLGDDGKSSEPDGSWWAGIAPGTPQYEWGQPLTSLPNFSTNIAAAWPALDWIRSQRDSVFVAFDTRDNRWEVEACDHVDYDTGKRDDGSNPRGCAVFSYGDTAPLAICRAALSLASMQLTPSPHMP